MPKSRMVHPLDPGPLVVHGSARQWPAVDDSARQQAAENGSGWQWTAMEINWDGSGVVVNGSERQ